MFNDTENTEEVPQENLEEPSSEETTEESGGRNTLLWVIIGAVIIIILCMLGYLLVSTLRASQAEGQTATSIAATVNAELTATASVPTTTPLPPLVTLAPPSATVTVEPATATSGPPTATGEPDETATLEPPTATGEGPTATAEITETAEATATGEPPTATTEGPTATAEATATEPTPTGAPPTETPEGPSIIDVNWEWTTLIENNSPILVPDPENYVLLLNPDNTLNVTADCNTATGNYMIDGSQISITITMSTTAFCGEESLSEEFMALIQQATAYTSQPSELLLDLTGNVEIEFQAAGS